MSIQQQPRKSSSSETPSAWLLLGFALAVAAPILTAAHFRMLHAPEKPDPYCVEVGQSRFLVFKPYLQGVDKVAYLASRSIGATEADEVAYSQARYTLVPTLVCARDPKPVVITNFDRDEELDATLKNGEFELVARVGPGMAVLRGNRP